MKGDDYPGPVSQGRGFVVLAGRGWGEDPGPMHMEKNPLASGATVVARFGALGDMVMLTSVLDVLAAGGRSPSVVVTSLGIADELYAGLASVESVTLVRSKRTPYLLEPSQWRWVKGLRREVAAKRVGSALSFTVVPRVPRLLERAGLPAAAIFSHQRIPRGELEHELAYGERLVRALAAAGAPLTLPPPDEWPAPRLEVTEAERTDAREWLGSKGWAGEEVVLLQTQSRKTRRGRWPTERWVALAQEIRRQRPECHLVFTGTPNEEETVAPIVSRLGDAQTYSAASAMSLRRLCALASVADSMVSLDTGPAHIAAAVGCPLTVLFGSEHPMRTRPTARPGSAVHEVAALSPEHWPTSRIGFAEQHKMENIRVDDVLGAWASLPARRG